MRYLLTESSFLLLLFCLCSHRSLLVESVTVTLVGRGNLTGDAVAFCGACWKEKTTQTIFMNWDSCAKSTISLPAHGDADGYKTWNVTLTQLSGCLLRWKWREVNDSKAIDDQYELKKKGDRSLNLHGVTEEEEIIVYTEFNHFGSDVRIPSYQNIVFHGNMTGSILPSEVMGWCGHCEDRSYFAWGDNCAHSNQVPISESMDFQFEIQLPVNCSLKWKWVVTSKDSRTVRKHESISNRNLLVEAGEGYLYVDSTYNTSLSQTQYKMYFPETNPERDTTISDRRTTLRKETSNSSDNQVDTTSSENSFTENLSSQDEGFSTVTGSYSTTRVIDPSSPTSAGSSASKTATVTKQMTKKHSTPITTITTTTTKQSTTTTTEKPATTTTEKSTTTTTAKATTTTTKQSITTTTGKPTATTPRQPTTTTLRQSTTTEVSVRPSTQTVSKAPAAPTTTPTSTSSDQGDRVQIVFYGHSFNWTRPKLRLCWACGNKTNFLASNECDEDIHLNQTTNETGRNNYSWYIAKMFPTSCGLLRVQWAAQWQVEGTWGYTDKDGAFISGWAWDNNSPDLIHVTDYAALCSNSAIHSDTTWGRPGTIKTTCGAVISSTASPSFPISVTYPPDNSEPADTTLPHSGLDELHIIVIVVGSVVVTAAIAITTFCLIRRQNQNRARFLRDVNFDDMDGMSLSYDGTGHLRSNPTERLSRLYRSIDLTEDNDSLSTPMYSFTGDVEDVHHRSGGGITTVYDMSHELGEKVNNNNSDKTRNEKSTFSIEEPLRVGEDDD